MKDGSSDPLGVARSGSYPVVTRPAPGLSAAAIAAIALVLGILVFAWLMSRPQAHSAPSVIRDDAFADAPTSIPPLYVPPAPPPPTPALPTAAEAPPAAATKPTAAEPRLFAPAPRSPPFIAPAPTYSPPATAAPVPYRSPSSRASLVVDNSLPRPAGAADNTAVAAGTLSTLVGGTERARSGALANPATTVAQGTSIPAVLESAVDTARPSIVRALVRADVRGFDGTHVLIPRGSRLIGEVRPDVQLGQKRANIIWTRLIRPDGITMAVGSLASDPLGRGGVRGKVETHFWDRFGGALLQSTLEIGASLAARSGGGSSVVLLPGSVSSVSSAASTASRPSDVPPTIQVPAGKTISVSVARDLDFTAAGD